MRRITKVALGGVASCALILGGTQAAGGALLQMLQVREPAEDFLMAPGPLDAAKGKITIGEAENGTTVFRLRVTGIDPKIAGTPLGSHLHIGACEEKDFGNPTATPSTAPGGKALGHYNHDVHFFGKAFPKPGELPSDTIAEVSPKTEVWFDLVPDAEGTASDKAKVSFLPVDQDGIMSVVVHVLPTNTELNNPNDPGPVGFAGGRQACFPLSVSGIFPKTPTE